MIQRQILALGVVFCLLVCVGAGCSRDNRDPNEGPSPTATSTVSDPQPLVLEGLSPTEAARKIVFMGGNLLAMRQSFSGPGKALAQTLGLGPTVNRTIVIKRFSPRTLVEVDWKATTTKQSVELQYVGALASGNLQSSHTLYPPVYWKEGVGNAEGNGILWLSQDVYEDLAKIHVSTFKFGLEDGELLSFASSSAQLRQSIRNLQAEIVKVIDRTDVFATKATTGTRSLIVNGKQATVAVLIAKNWFGEMQILNNPQNPLVLSIKMGKPGGIDFGGIFDYEITELIGLRQ